MIAFWASAVGDRHDDLRSVVAAQLVDAEAVAEIADRGPDPFPTGEIRGRDLLGGAGAVEVGELGVHGDPPARLLSG
jgi:hypothetical protein